MSPEAQEWTGSASASHLVKGAATKAELEGIKWFRPRSAMKDGGEGDGGAGAIKKPNFKLYTPPRQPTGPDGSVGFKRRNPDWDKVVEEEEAAGDGGNGDVEGNTGKAVNGDANGVDAEEDGEAAAPTSSVRSIKLNPDVPAFEFPIV